MFDDDDPQLARVREIALGFPGAAEKISHGRPVFFTTKVFTHYGWLRRHGDWQDWRSQPRTVVVLPDADERAALLQDERCFHPAYLGPSGWVAFELPAARAAKRHWAEVAELIDASYRNTAGKRLIAELDARLTHRPRKRAPARSRSAVCSSAG